MKNLLLILTTILIAAAGCGIEQSSSISSTENQAIWYAPESTATIEQCPCCDYYSLPERGSYLICPICYWEDDGMDIDDLDSPSGPNHGITLREGRSSFESIGACEKEMLKHVSTAKERKGFKREIRTLNSFDGYLDVISPYKTLIFKVITKDLKNSPTLYLYPVDSDKLIYEKGLPSSDTTIVDFGELKLKEGLYQITIKDKLNNKFGQSFVVRNKKNLK